MTTAIQKRDFDARVQGVLDCLRPKKAHIQIVTMEEVATWADDVLNYFDEEGNLVIAPDTPEFRQKKQEWEIREFRETRTSL